MKKEYDEKTCVCALNRIFGFDPATAHALIGAAGSAWGLFSMSQEEKARAFGPFSKVRDSLSERELERTEEELRRLSDYGADFITMSQEGYPALLRECEDAPLGLYYRGVSKPEEVFNLRPQIAVVGTRDISLYGKEWCRKTVEAMSLARSKPLIVSGLAIGTDIIAHMTALEGGLPTVAVIPTGIDNIYPGRHRRFAETLVSTPGCAIITDYPPLTEPKPINFIRRNRIIAGSCSGTILIESKERGGGMITARLASSYDRDLLILPGRADDQRSQGCNRLLREKLAEPITDTTHFLDMLGLGAPTRRKKENLEMELRARYGATCCEKDLADIVALTMAIRRNRGITLDDLCPLTCMPYAKVAALAGTLESDGIISIDLLQRCSINLKID